MTFTVFTQFVKVVTPPTDFLGLIIFKNDFRNNHFYIILFLYTKEIKIYVISFACRNNDNYKTFVEHFVPIPVM